MAVVNFANLRNGSEPVVTVAHQLTESAESFLFNYSAGTDPNLLTVRIVILSVNYICQPRTRKNLSGQSAQILTRRHTTKIFPTNPNA
jgi:hypothetical protein